MLLRLLLKQSQQKLTRIVNYLNSAKSKKTFVYGVKIPNPSKDLRLSLEDLKAVAQVRGIEDYESISRDELSSTIFPLKNAKKEKKVKKPKTSFSKARIKEIREKFNESRYKFSKLKIKEIRENLYKIEKGKNLSKSKIKEIEKFLLN